jgi:hypothetical protein
MLKEITVPCYCDITPASDCPEHKVVVDEFASRLCLTVSDKEHEIEVEVEFEDLVRAWEAVKR